MLEDSMLEKDDLALHELESPEPRNLESVPAFAREREPQPLTQETVARHSALSDEGRCRHCNGD